MKPPDNKYAVQTLFKVIEFVDRQGKKTNKREDQTIMVASDVDSKISLPFSMDIARKCKLKIGSKFIEHIEYVRV